MRFLILTQYFPPEIGAPQVRLASIARELARLGHEVEIVTALPNHPTGRVAPAYRRKLYVRDTWEGMSVHRLWLYASTGAGLKRMWNYASFTFAAFFGLWRARKPDYLFVESPPLFLSLPARWATLIWRVPFIFNVADLWPDSVAELGVVKNQRLLRWAGRLEAWSYRKAHFVNAVTEGIRSDLLTKKGVPPEKILFLPNGVDVRLFKPRSYDATLARDLGVDDKQVLLYAGTIGYAHGIDVALRALACLRGEVHNLVLVIIGDGSEKQRMVNMSEALKLDNVIFLDPHPLEFVAELYTVAQAGLVTIKDVPLLLGARPSKTFPIMASGKPVLYSGAGEGARLVEEADAGLVARPEDPEALAEVIRTLLRDPEEAARMGASGRRYVEKHLSWTALIECWLDELRERNGGVDATR